MADPVPPRSPDEVTAVVADLTALGACCGHAYGLHGPDGSCRMCGVLRVSCPGWKLANQFLYGIEDTAALSCSTAGCGHRADRHYESPDHETGLEPCRMDDCRCGQWTYVIPDHGEDDGVVQAEVLSSGDPLTDLLHDVLARHWPGYAGREFMACRDQLITEVRGWAGGALGIEIDPA